MILMLACMYVSFGSHYPPNVPGGTDPPLCVLSQELFLANPGSFPCPLGGLG